MASRPDDDRLTEEAAAAALLIGARYDLPAIIRARRLKPRPFRRIEATEALRGSIAAPYFVLVRAWQAERAVLLAAYANALPDRGQPLEEDAVATVQRQADRSSASIASGLAVLLASFLPAMRRVDRWHEVQWNTRIKAATGIDVSMFAPGPMHPEVANAVAWNQQLLRQVHTEVQGTVTATLTGGLQQRAPASDMASSLNDVMVRTKKRVARIGVDQTDSLEAALSRARRVQANLVRFRWRHTEQPRPRLEHLKRDNRIYTPNTAPNDRAGTLPFCKCWEEPLWG